MTLAEELAVALGTRVYPDNKDALIHGDKLIVVQPYGVSSLRYSKARRWVKERRAEGLTVVHVFGAWEAKRELQKEKV